ncbi:MAG: 50S ribosomal protein L19e [Thermoplasmata archaeon]|nr:MAG: 50S ribosomal protein L19e [Thermoplasmata archaeon]
MNLRNQRRVAAELLKCGVNRVWIDPLRTEDVAEAVTRQDIRSLIKIHAIRAHQKRGISSGRAKYNANQKKKGKRKALGSRKGTKYARYPKKRRWISTIRPIRRRLREYRDAGKIDSATYRKFYLHAKGGMYKNLNHLELQLKQSDAFKSMDKKEGK